MPLKLPKLPKLKTPKMPKMKTPKLPKMKTPKMPSVKAPKLPGTKSSLLPALPILSFYKGNIVGMIFNVIFVVLLALNIYVLMNPPSESMNYSSFWFGVMAITMIGTIAFNILSADSGNILINMTVLVVVAIPVIANFVRVITPKEEKKEEKKA